MSTHHTDWQCGKVMPDGKSCTVPLVDWGGGHETIGPCDSTLVDPWTEPRCPCRGCREDRGEAIPRV